MVDDTAGTRDDESRRRPGMRGVAAFVVAVLVAVLLVQVVAVPVATGFVCGPTTTVSMPTFAAQVSVDGDRLVVSHRGGDVIGGPDRLSLVVRSYREEARWAVYEFDRARAQYPVGADDRFVFTNVSVDGRPPRAGDLVRVRFRAFDSPPDRRWYCYLHATTQYQVVDEQRLDANGTGVDV
jgi:hypothetical protein